MQKMVIMVASAFVLGVIIYFIFNKSNRLTCSYESEDDIFLISSSFNIYYKKDKVIKIKQNLNYKSKSDNEFENYKEYLDNTFEQFNAEKNVKVKKKNIGKNYEIKVCVNVKKVGSDKLYSLGLSKDFIEMRNFLAINGFSCTNK